MELNHAERLRTTREQLKKRTRSSVLLRWLFMVLISPLFTVFYLVKEAVVDFGRNKAFIHGAALAYYTVFSLPPMLLIIIMSMGFFIGEDQVKYQIITFLKDHLGTDQAVQIASVLEKIYPHNKGFVATTVGFATLFFSSTIIFYTLKDSLNTFWRVQSVKGQGILMMIFNRVTAFFMVILLGCILFLVVISETILVAVNHYFEESLGDETNQLIANSHSSFSIVSFMVITLLFALIFKYLPDAKISWRDVFVGAFVTSVLFTAGQIGISWYLGRSSVIDSYGAAGSVIIILSWVFYSSQILYFGAEFTYVYAEALGSGVKQSKLSKLLNRLF